MMFPTTFISLQQKGFSLGGNWGFKSYDQKGVLAQDGARAVKKKVRG